VGFIVFLAFWAISFVAGQLLRGWLAKPPNAEPGEVEAPRAEDGQRIPAVFGTVKLAPNVLWFGDVEAVPVKKRVQTSLFTSTRQTIGYKYLVGMQGGLCWGPVDELVDIILADKYKASDIEGLEVSIDAPVLGRVTFTAVGVSPQLPLPRVDAGRAITFEAPLVYGGREKEGGVDGLVRFYYGSTTQAKNAYMAGQTVSTLPAYKGLCHVVWEHVDMGQNPYLKPWAFVVRRCPTTLGVAAGDTTLSRIGDDANPAEVLYELLTDHRWGLGRPTGDYSTASFITALETLADEELGISGTHLGASTADEKVKEILNTIDGVLVPDAVTGKIGLTLIRADYTVADLETLDASNSHSLDYTRTDTPELVTEVKVRYTDASAGFTTRTAPAYNPAVRQISGRSHPHMVDYPLVSTRVNGDRLALRDLKSLSSTLATGSLTATRAAASLTPGAAFVINYPDDGLTSTVVRATRINYGSPHDSEAIEVQWTEDVFGVASGVFVTDPEETPADPIPPTFAGITVTPELTLDDTQGCVELVIEGRVDRIISVEMRRREGDGAYEDWVAFAYDDPPLLCVDRDARAEGAIGYQVTYTESDGTEDVIEGEVPIPPIAPDDGVAEGTPGDFQLTMRAGPALRIRDVPAAFTVHIYPQTDWKYCNFSQVRRLRGQVGSGEAGSTGTTLAFAYSLDGGDTWAELGPTVPLDAISYPSLGAFATIAAPARVDNVLLGWGTKGGDGATPVKVGNIYVDAVSAETPPDSDDGTPPPGSELPPVPPQLFWSRGGDLMFADQEGTIPHSGVHGEGVPLWGDKTGNGNDWLIGLLAASAPDLNTSVVERGIPSIEFSGGSAFNYYSLPGAAWGDANNASIAIRKKMKAQPPAAANASGVYHFGRNRASNDTAHPWTTGAHYETFGRSYQINLGTLPGRDFTEWHTYIVTFDHPSRRYRIYFDGVMIVANTTDPDSAGGMTFPSNCFLGRSITHQGNYYCNEIMGWGQELTEAEAMAVHLFMSTAP
jgi:hypothetical protein